ncbi:MAG TPA: J domain-containing protein [Desulfobacteria bacterium]|nr:J domain-containing protein [Desulfobacteria bacterium]
MAVKFQDYYEVLGVKRDANQKEIKSAYHKLARKWHPDLHTGSDKQLAEETIKKINEAYEVLSDPDKRAKYDRLGANWQAGQDFQAPPGMDGFEYYTNVGGAGDFSDFFEMLFGGSSPFGQGTRRHYRGPLKGEDIEALLEVTLEDIHLGAERSIQLTVGQAVKTLTVKIPTGIGEGARVRLKGQGGEGRNGGENGDLYLKIHLLPHPRFQVTDDQLQTELKLRPEQAVLGDKVTVLTLDGPVTMKVPPRTGSGQRLRLRGKGLNRKTGQGDLYVKITVDIPTQLTLAEEELYRKLLALKRNE